MSTQKDIKTPDTKGEKTGNEIAARKAPLREPQALAPYSKSKLSNKPICRKSIKPITQQLKVNGKTLKESLLDLPRFTLYFILHGKVIQEYLDLFAMFLPVLRFLRDLLRRYCLSFFSPLTKRSSSMVSNTK